MLSIKSKDFPLCSNVTPQQCKNHVLSSYFSLYDDRTFIHAHMITENKSGNKTVAHKIRKATEQHDLHWEKREGQRKGIGLFPSTCLENFKYTSKITERNSKGFTFLLLLFFWRFWRGLSKLRPVLFTASHKQTVLDRPEHIRTW